MSVVGEEGSKSRKSGFTEPRLLTSHDSESGRKPWVGQQSQHHAVCLYLGKGDGSIYTAPTMCQAPHLPLSFFSYPNNARPGGHGGKFGLFLKCTGK